MDTGLREGAAACCAALVPCFQKQAAAGYRLLLLYVAEIVLSLSVVGSLCQTSNIRQTLTVAVIFDSAAQAILELHWSPNSPNIITCSADKTLGFWDANAGKRKKTFKVIDYKCF